MFCKKCGKELPEGSKFCQNCGSPILDDGFTDRSGASQNIKSPLRPKRKRTVIVIGVVILGLLLLFTLLSGRDPVKDVKSLSFNGAPPIGDIIDTTCDNIQWAKESLGSDSFLITASGSMKAIPYHSELKGEPVYLVFYTVYHGNVVTAQVQDGQCDGKSGSEAYERLYYYYKFQIGELGYVNGDFVIGSASGPFDDPVEYEAEKNLRESKNSVNLSRDSISWDIFGHEYKLCSNYEKYAVEGYYNLNLIQVSYREFIDLYPEYSDTYYYTNVLDHNSDEYKNQQILEEFFGTDNGGMEP